MTEQVCVEKVGVGPAQADVSIRGQYVRGVLSVSVDAAKGTAALDFLADCEPKLTSRVLFRESYVYHDALAVIDAGDETELRSALYHIAARLDAWFNNHVPPAMLRALYVGGQMR